MKTLESVLHTTPGGGSKIGWSMLSMFLECELRWFLANVVPHPKGGFGVAERPSRALTVGALFHAGLAAFLQTGEDESGLAAIETAKVEFGGAPEEYLAEWVEEAGQLYRRYAKECGPAGPDPDSDRFAVAVDPDGRVVERDYTVDLGYNGYYFTTRIDAVAWDVVTEGTLLIVEHKTCDVSRVGMALRDYQVSGQLTGEMMAVQAAYPEVECVIPVINLVKKRAAAKNAVRSWEPMPRSPADVEKFRNDVIRRLRRMDAAVAEYQELVAAGVEPLEAGNLVFDGSPKVGTCSGCAFYEACYRRTNRRQWLATTEPRHAAEVVA